MEHLKRYRKLTRTAFREWLESYKASSIVGYAVYVTDCPLVRFVRNLEAADARIQIICYLTVNNKAYKLPDWADRFIDKIDDEKKYRPITARDALKALASI